MDGWLVAVRKQRDLKHANQQASILWPTPLRGTQAPEHSSPGHAHEGELEVTILRVRGRFVAATRDTLISTSTLCLSISQDQVSTGEVEEIYIGKSLAVGRYRPTTCMQPMNQVTPMPLNYLTRL